MIRTFAHRGLERFFREGTKSGIQPKHEKRLRLILGLLDTARSPQDLSLPGLRLHALAGQLRGHWSVSVSGPWRVTFQFEEGDAWKVDYVQYH